MSDFQLPLQHLFQRMRQAGLQLTPEHYNLLRESLSLGFGWDWESLERVCKLLWVKPSLNNDRQIFQAEFDRFRQQHQERFQAYCAAQEPKPVPEVPLGVLPTLPARRIQTQDFPAPEASPSSPSRDRSDEDGIGAINPASWGKRIKKDLKYEPWNVPLSLDQVEQLWKLLRSPIVNTQIEEFDWDATENRIAREGLIDPVMRFGQSKATELLLLIDEGNGLVPFAPVYQPWVQVVEQRKIPLAQIYQFNGGVSDCLFDWHHPLRAVPLQSVLWRLQKQRTIVLIISDAGAATQQMDDEQVQAMRKLLQRLSHTARLILWFNPIPEKFWHNTTAAEIAQWFKQAKTVAGMMLSFEQQGWKAIADVARQERKATYAS